MPCLSASPLPGHLCACINGPSTKWLWEEIDTMYGNEDRHVLSPQLSWPLPLLSVQLSKPESNTEPLLGIVSWEHLPLRSIILDHSILEGAVMCLYGNNCIFWRVTPLSYRWCFCQHHHMWLIGCLFTPMVSHTSLPLTEELIYREITVVLGADIKKSIVLTSPRSTWLDGMMACHIEDAGFFSIQFLFYIRV